MLRSLVHTAYVDPAATFNALGLEHNILSFQFTHREDNVDQWFMCTCTLRPNTGLVISLLVEEQMGGLAPPPQNPLRFALTLTNERRYNQSSAQQALVTQIQNQQDAGAASPTATGVLQPLENPPDNQEV